ncbi:MAG: DsbA family protein [Nitrospiraceae bacterium]
MKRFGFSHRPNIRRYLLPALASGAALALLLSWLLGNDVETKDAVMVEATTAAGPPWRYGRSDARFTVVEYADLECPYCQAYFPILKQWIGANPDVNWQWHHLPLAIHEPAATRGARLAECAGEAGGPAAFWNAIGWIYEHTRGDGQGLPPDAMLPGTTRVVEECLASTRPDAVISAQAAEASQAGIAATPTVRLLDNTTGKSLLLPGAIEGDALLSAADLLASPSADTATLEPASGTQRASSDDGSPK